MFELACVGWSGLCWIQFHHARGLEEVRSSGFWLWHVILSKHRCVRSCWKGSYCHIWASLRRELETGNLLFCRAIVLDLSECCRCQGCGSNDQCRSGCLLMCYEQQAQDSHFVSRVWVSSRWWFFVWMKIMVVVLGSYSKWLILVFTVFYLCNVWNTYPEILFRITLKFTEGVNYFFWIRGATILNE